MASLSNSTSADDKPEIQETIESPTVSIGSSVEELEKTVTPLTPPPPDAIDGGLRSWLQVLGSFLVFGNLWGFTFCFGSFQSFYELTYLRSETASNISWIGTMSVFLLIVGGVVTGPLFDLGYFRTMLFAGAGLEIFGVFMMSLCSRYYQLFLAQGIVMGLGNGLLYIPGLALVGRSFKKHRSIAMAITTCGAPTGGIIYTLIFEQLISTMGFGSTVRVMGYVMLGSYSIAFPLLLWGVSNIGNLSSGTKRRLLDLRAFNDLPFCVYTASNFLLFLGYMVPFNYIASYGQTVLGLSRSFSLSIIMVAQASSILGRMCAGYTASRFGVMIPWIICGLSSGIVTVAWVGVRTQGAFIAYAALYGCFSGALIPLPPSVFPVVCPDPKVLGARLGMAQGICSMASLVGSPIGGALTAVGSRNDGGKPNYIGLQLFTGLVMITGGINLCGLWILLSKRRGLKFL